MGSDWPMMPIATGAMFEETLAKAGLTDARTVRDHG